MPPGFIELCIILIIAILVAIMFRCRGAGQYSSITMGFVFLLALSFLLDISTKTIGVLLFVWTVSILWILSYSINKCVESIR